MSAIERLRLVVLGLLAAALTLVFLFLPAGRLDWWPGWAYLGLLFASAGATAAVLFRHDPELARRRSRLGEGTKGWDRLVLFLLKLSFLSLLVVGALDDGRFGWSWMAPWAWIPAAAAHTAGMAILTRSMLENTHFEPTVRIQRDRDHRVVDTGPYRYVRHPGYAGFLLVILSTPALLLSWWAYLPAAGGIAVLLVRTSLEERVLRAGLPGYAEYAERVRCRFVPGVW